MEPYIAALLLEFIETNLQYIKKRVVNPCRSRSTRFYDESEVNPCRSRSAFFMLQKYNHFPIPQTF